jgi:transcriptional regulator GlxA family with amidase domain
MQIEILLFHGFDELDAIGPYEVLAGVGAATGGLDVQLVSLGGPGLVRAGHGTRVHSHTALSSAPDLVIIPGGGLNDGRAEGVRAELARGELPRAIANRHAAGARVGSVCTGALLVAAAGLLDGRPAVTHHSALDELRASGATVIEDARVVDDGDVLSAGGVTAGIDLALWIVERELGPDVAAAAARELEYERAGAVWRDGTVESAAGR